MTENNHSKNNSPIHHENHHETVKPHVQHNEDNTRNSEATLADKIDHPNMSHEK